MHAGVLVDHVVHEVAANEAAATCHDDVLGLEGLCHERSFRLKTINLTMLKDSAFPAQHAGRVHYAQK